MRNLMHLFHWTRRGLLTLAVALLAACGGGQIILNLDILSFLDEQNQSASYDLTLPATGDWLPLTGLVPPTKVELLEGLGTASLLEEGVLTAEGEFDHQSGSGEAKIEVFLGASSEDVIASVDPVLSVIVDLQDSTVTPFSTTGDLDEATLDLFSGNEIWVRLDVSARIGSGLGQMHFKGDVLLNALSARLLSTEDLIRQ